MKKAASILNDIGNCVSCDQWLQVMDELNIGAFTVSTHRRVAAINLSAQALIGQNEAEVVGRDCREVFVGVPCLANCPFRSDRDGVTSEPVIQLQDEDAETHLVTRRATPVYGPDHRVVGCMTVLQDQSPIANLIDRIHFEKRSLKIVLDNLDIGIFTIDRSGNITFFNHAAEKISGHSRTKILGKPCETIFSGRTSTEICRLKDTIADGVSRSSARGRMLTADGLPLPIRADYMALRNEKGTVVGGLATFQDLTLVEQLNRAIIERYSFHDMIGKSPQMQQIFEMVGVVAGTDATILIEGATGTGKDLLAKVIHSESFRADGPFVKVNCAAIPENLLESELFGYVKGAFTDAKKDKTGRFQEAEGGTIFLDEIGDLPLSLQAKLLRVIEDKEFYRLGSQHTSKVNVRIISATNRDLRQLVARGLFRKDLFYRLNVFWIKVPELTERRVDLPILINHILRRLCAAKGVQVPDISQRAMEVLLNYPYPGNIRELENILEHAVILCRDDTIQPNSLPDYLYQGIEESGVEPDSRAAPDERALLLAALNRNKWHKAKTAQSLGIDRTTLWRKMKKFGL
jgi:PAS domain S-box-containing protein